MRDCSPAILNVAASTGHALDDPQTPFSSCRSNSEPRLTSGPLLAAHPSPWDLYTPRQRWGFLLILFAVCACNYFDYSVLSVMLDPIKKEFKVSDTMLGLLGGLSFALVYAIAGLPIARWADRGNRRTVITCALAAWSTATALCGVAQSFWQLAAARFALGAAEPGALPPAQSLIADYFPPGNRATAIAVLTQGGSAVGWLAGVALGGSLAARYGWRAAFLVAGVAGLVLSLLVRIGLREPRCELGFRRPSEGMESIAQSFTQLQRKRTYLLLLLGLSAYSIFSYGFSIFLPSFMMRSLHASLTEVSVTWGVAIAAANFLGALIGGWLGDRLSRRDVRWYARLTALACAVALPAYGFALRTDDFYSFIGRDFIAELLISIGLPSAFAAAHLVCGNRRRAIAVATLLLALTLFGSGFGPLIAGWLSDAFSSTHGIESLRYSLTSMLVLLIPAAVAFGYASKGISKDIED